MWLKVTPCSWKQVPPAFGCLGVTSCLILLGYCYNGYTQQHRPLQVQVKEIIQEFLPYIARGHVKVSCICPEIGQICAICLAHALS